jgi:hypothetical protein
MFRRRLKIDKREAQNDICLIATMLAQVGRRLFPFEASALRRRIYIPRSVPRLPFERPCSSLWRTVYRDSEPFPQPLVESTT